MLALAAALVVSLSLGEGGGPRKPTPPAARPAPGATLSNAARARAGLLPRKAPLKAPRKHAANRNRAGRRIITAVSHSPTFLGEPIPLAEAPPDAAVHAAAAPVAAAPREVRDLRLAATSVVTDVTLVLRYAP